MRHILFLSLILLMLFLALNNIQAHPPEKVMVVKLPLHASGQWIAISPQTDDNIARIEWTPSNKPLNQQVESIYMQYQDCSNFEELPSIESIYEGILNQKTEHIPKELLTINTISKSQSELVFEWTQKKKHRGKNPLHEIGRITIVDEGYHFISYTYFGKTLSSKERKSWLSVIQSALLVDHEWGKACIDGISLAPLYKKHFALAEKFNDWSTLSYHLLNNFYSSHGRAPADQLDTTKITEILWVTTYPAPSIGMLDKVFAMEKQSVIETFKPNKVHFDILRKTPTEMVYTYSERSPDTDMDLIINAVVRTFVTNKGYYSLSYRRALPHKATKEQISEWVAILDESQLIETNSSSNFELKVVPAKREILSKVVSEPLSGPLETELCC